MKLWGPGATTPVTASATVSVSNKTVYATPLPFGEESMYAQFNEGDPATANNLLDNVWPARGYALPYLAWPLTWTEDPYNDAFWRFYYYGMQPLPTLLYEWKTTGNTAYLDKLIAILRSYVAYDQVRPVNTTTFDNNHAAAYRAMALVQFYVKLKNAGVLPADLDAGLVQSLQKLGTFLAVPSHFEADYNHGFNEGAALLLIADNFPLLRELVLVADARAPASAADARPTRSTPTASRSRTRPSTTCTSSGSSTRSRSGRSPTSPRSRRRTRAAAQKMLRVRRRDHAAERLPADARRDGNDLHAEPGSDRLRADGRRGSRVRLRLHDAARTDAAAGRDRAVPRLGPLRHALAARLASRTWRTRRTSPSTPGTYRTSHSDLDALGITMYSNGSTLLPTSGLFTYTQQPDLEYFHGTRSHNTVVVDGQDQPQGSAHAGSYGSTGGSTWATGTSDLYAGVHHQRTVVVLRQGLTLVVDRLTGAASHAYTQTWHLAPDANVDASGGDAYVVERQPARAS